MLIRIKSVKVPVEAIIRRVLELADAAAAAAGLNSPTVNIVEVLEKDPSFEPGLVKVAEGAYVEPTSASIYVVKATLDLIILRIVAAYYALATLATFGFLDAEKAAEMARETYYRLLVRI